MAVYLSNIGLTFDILHLSQRTVHRGAEQSIFVLSFRLAVLLWSQQACPKKKTPNATPDGTKHREGTKSCYVGNSKAKYNFFTFIRSVGSTSNFFLMKLDQKLACFLRRGSAYCPSLVRIKLLLNTRLGLTKVFLRSNDFDLQLIF